MKRNMRILCGSYIVSVTLLCILYASADAGVTSVKVESFAQAERVSLPTRIKGWTRVQWNAAKKRWAKDREKFAACVQKLNESPEAKRFSYHNQTHFIETCMREKTWP